MGLRQRRQLAGQPASVSASTRSGGVGRAPQRARDAGRLIRPEQLKQHGGQSADVIASPLRPARRSADLLRPTQTAEDGATAFVQKDVGRLDGTVAETDGMEICHGGGQGGPEAGDYRPRLDPKAGQIAPTLGAQNQGRRRVTALRPHQLDHARMGDSTQHDGLVRQPGSFVGRAGPFVRQTLGLTCHLHIDLNYIRLQ